MDDATLILKSRGSKDASHMIRGKRNISGISGSLVTQKFLGRGYVWIFIAVYVQGKVKWLSDKTSNKETEATQFSLFSIAD